MQAAATFAARRQAGAYGLAAPATLPDGLYPWEDPTTDGLGSLLWSTQLSPDRLGVQLAHWIAEWLDENRTTTPPNLWNPVGAEAWFEGGVRPAITGQNPLQHLDQEYRHWDEGRGLSGIVADSAKQGKRARPAPCGAWLDGGAPQTDAGSIRTCRLRPWPQGRGERAAAFAKEVIEAARKVLLKYAGLSHQISTHLDPLTVDHLSTSADYRLRSKAASSVTALYVTRYNPTTGPSGPDPNVYDQIWFVALLRDQPYILHVINEDSAEPGDDTELYRYL